MNKKISFNTATPILIIETTQDLATPYERAKNISEYILDSHQVTLKGEGQTIYGHGIWDVEHQIEGYLLGIGK